MTDRAHTIVSFTTRPGRGSEGGVGWAFAAAAARLAASESSRLHLVIDGRDEAPVRRALGRLPPADVHLHVISMPPRSAGRYGDARTRASYLSWWRAANRVVSRLADEDSGIFTTHQVTFATSSLPPVHFYGVRGTRIWGPITSPSNPLANQGGHVGIREAAGVDAARHVGRLHARRMSRVIATNDSTADSLASTGRVIQVEPNIVAEPQEPTPYDEKALAISGLLIARKRPWLAIKAMTRPELSGYTLNVIGDGALRASLEDLVREEGLGGRVLFHGHVARERARQLVQTCAALLHPSAREGSPWAVGEAAAAGVRAVVFRGTGADTTARLAENGSAICPDGDIEAMAAAAATAATMPRALPSRRWSADRIPALLGKWRSGIDD